MFFTKKVLSVLGVTIMVAGINGATASNQTGRCTNFEFPLDRKGEVDWPRPVKVIIDNTPVYQDSTSSVETDKTLDFSSSVMVMEAEINRVQVRRITSRSPMGWVDRSALLCAFIPLKSKSGLEQKFYIRTATEVRKDKPSTVKAYHSPDLKSCGDSKCFELSRFSGYFVFDYDKMHKSYLLSDYYKLDEGYKLTGWVSKTNGFVWDTAYGMRPKEEFEEKTICAYAKKEHASEERKCMPILGGERWLMIEHRIPIIDHIEIDGKSFYKVVLPLAGQNSEEVADKKIKLAPENLNQNTGITSLLNLKKIDVFFLIDGTSTMEPYIESIKGTGTKKGIVREIIEALKKDPAFKEAQFRFGFRIYRDKYAGEKELGDGLPLGTTCELTYDSENNNKKKFEKAIRKIVKASTIYVDRDDYEENLFGGINQAIKDLHPCPEHTKLLFIIGDHGYSAEAQRHKGRKPINMSFFVNKLKGSKEKGIKNIVTYFLQAPKDSNRYKYVKYPELYDQAHRLFKEQAYEILRQILPPERKSDDFFIQINDRKLNSKIIASVKGFSNTQAINELILDLRGGTDLVNAIKRLQGSREYNNIPGLFWDIVEQAGKKELGKQYDTRVYDAVLDGYIPVSEDIVEEVWLKSEDIGNWELLLKNFGDQTHLGGSELREAFGFAIKDALEKVIRKPLYEDVREPLEVYLKRKGGLPVRNKSPLFRYSLEDLNNKDSVPDCELIRLTTWINNARMMLNIASHGDVRPKYKAIKFPGECPSGEHIPFIDGDIKRIPVGSSPDMRFDHSFQKAHIYWIPKEYLP